MKRIFFFSLIFVFSFLYVSFAGETKYILEKKWETKKKFQVPESVLYDPVRNVIYVSNIKGNPGRKDGNGFISKVALDGKIEKLKWIKGLDAPKGLGIYKDKLYVADLDLLVEIDINKGKVLNKYPAPNAIFLNDVAVDDSGNVYVSDTAAKNSVIYRFRNGKITVWIKDKKVNQPNGLYAEGNKLIFGNFGDGCLNIINLSNKQITTLARTGAGIDGIAGDGNGNYFISDWEGKTSLVCPSGQIIELLNTTAQKINAADISFIRSKKLLLVPTFFDNRIMAYEVR